MGEEHGLVKAEDIEVEEIDSEIKDSESTRSLEYEIMTYPADFTLEVLYGKWKAGDIEFPGFQRGFVWKIAQSSRLVESFMMGLPVPQIFFYTERSSHKLLVIDGQQRLKSVFYFIEGYFGEEDKSGRRKTFRLKGLEEHSKWDKKQFKDFDEADDLKFKGAVLRAVVIKQLDPEDDTSIYHIFERLNTGGTLLTTQEVRNCVYSGTLNDFLFELNEYGNWREILGKPDPDSRQRDVELILRYLALLHEGETYKKPMKEFLSVFMKHHQNPEDSFIEVERERFIRTCDILVEKFGGKPFHLRGPLNAATFDSVFVTFAKHETIPEDIVDRYEKLKLNLEFDESTRLATTDNEVVRNRLKLVETILFG